jgi:protein-disulfide reductase (glutathione)
MRDTRTRPLGRFTFLGWVAASALVALSLPDPARAGGDWNDFHIAWQAYEAGLAAAKAQKKPILLVLYTDWCPHCTSYSAVFHDDKVVEKAKSFVMIRLNKDQNAEISKKYAPDGEYIPRTYFLSAEGVPDYGIHAPRPEYKYFYDEANPASLLQGMDEALKKLKPSA